MVKKLVRDNRGAALVEYGMLVAGVALVGAAAVSVFGHKASDLMATMAAVLPGAHAHDNGPIVSGHLLETTLAPNPIALNITGIVANANTPRLSENLGAAGPLAQLVVDPGQ